jgi:hypothetical protein
MARRPKRPSKGRLERLRTGKKLPGSGNNYRHIPAVPWFYRPASWSIGRERTFPKSRFSATYQQFPRTQPDHTRTREPDHPSVPEPYAGFK